MDFPLEHELVNLFNAVPYEKDESIGMLAFTSQVSGGYILYSFSENERWFQIKLFLYDTCIIAISSDALSSIVIEKKDLVVRFIIGSKTSLLRISTSESSKINWEIFSEITDDI